MLQNRQLRVLSEIACLRQLALPLVVRYDDLRRTKDWKSRGRYNLTNSKVPMITDLSEEERKSVEQWIRLVPAQFRQCECYLKDYAAGTQVVGKLISVMDATSDIIEDACKDLIERHKLPDYPKAP